MSLAEMNRTLTGPAPSGGNSTWAAEYMKENREVVENASKRAPRSQQVHLGPSELGEACDRQVVGKLTRAPKLNVMSDPWPSVVGTAVHAWLEEAYNLYNEQNETQRWMTEQRVYPHDDHGGTGDLYDAEKKVVGDHKVLGDATLNNLKRSGPPRKYEAQLYLYALGFEKMGYDVERVALLAWPRTRSNLDAAYCWESPFDEKARALVDEVFADTERRKAQAALVEQGLVTLGQVPATPGDGCNFCPLLRRGAEVDPNGPFRGCPGNSAAK